MTEQHTSCTCNHSTFAGFHDADCPKFTKKCKHEWKLKAYLYVGVPVFACSGDNCDAMLSVREAETRLNATERLSAEMAREIGDCLYAGIIDHERKSAVLAYADILEGKP